MAISTSPASGRTILGERPRSAVSYAALAAHAGAGLREAGKQEPRSDAKRACSSDSRRHRYEQLLAELFENREAVKVYVEIAT